MINIGRFKNRLGGRLMTRKEIYDIMDSTIKSYFPCFCHTSSRKWVKRFYESHYEVFSTKYWIELNDERVTLYDLKEIDLDLWTKYYNRWMKQGVSLTSAYVEECIIKHEENEKKKQQKAKTSTKRKKSK